MNNTRFLAFPIAAAAAFTAVALLLQKPKPRITPIVTDSMAYPGWRTYRSTIAGRPAASHRDNSQYLGFEIVNTCPCGAKVKAGDEQDLVFDGVQQKWYRYCYRCIGR